MNIFNIDPATVDPNLAYLLLVAALWVGVAAIYAPGTGLLEVVSIGALLVSTFMLTIMPTNWAAVLILVVGVLSFIIMPFIKRQFIPLAVIGLLLQGIGGVFLFNGIQVPWLLIAFTIGLSLIYYQFILVPMLNRTRDEPTILYDDTLIGSKARVLTSLKPVGTVQLRGETWSAISESALEVGEEVVVVERNGLQLSVVPLKEKHAPENG